jgi:hypothetical protein
VSWRYTTYLSTPLSLRSTLQDSLFLLAPSPLSRASSCGPLVGMVESSLAAVTILLLLLSVVFGSFLGGIPGRLEGLGSFGVRVSGGIVMISIDKGAPATCLTTK